MLWIILLLTLFLLFVIHTTKRLTYWRDKNVYHETPVPVFGNVLKVFLRQEPIGYTLKHIYDKLDESVPYFGVYIFHTPVLVLRSREMIKNVIIKNFSAFSNRTQYANDNVDPIAARNLFALKNEVWRTLRIKLSPVFTSGKMKLMMPLMKEVTDQLQEVLENSEGDDIDIRDLSRRYSIDIISSCAFGINSESLKNEKSEIKEMASQMLDQTSFKRSFAMFAWFFCPILVDIFRIPFVDKESSQFLAEVYNNSVKERKRMNVKRNDLIDLLNGLKEEEKPNDIIKFDDTTVHSQALTFFNAGAEGAATMMSLCLYELAINRNIQNTLWKEISQSVDANGSISYDTLFQMEYLDLVVKETLRKFPFIQFFGRYAENDYVFPETGLKIEMGTQILIPMLAIHYNPIYFPDPEKFDPERFRGDKMKDLQFAFLPFGDGPRKCIGDRFALMSLKTGLAMFLKDFEVVPGDKTEIPLKFEKAATFLTPKNGTLFLRILKRRTI